MTIARLLPALVLATLVASGCTDLGDDVAIRAGDLRVTLEELRLAYANLEPAGRPPLATAEQRRAFARRVLERKLIATAGLRDAATDSAAFAADIARDRQTILLRRLRVVEAGPAETDSSEAAAAYERMRVRRRVQALACATEAAALAARARVEAGEPFEALQAREIGAAEEADVWMVWQPQPDPITDAILDVQPGALVGPVRARGGWFVLRVLESEPYDPGSWDEVRVRIHQGLRNRRELEAMERLTERAREESSLRFDEAGIDRIVALTREAILRPGATEQEETWAIPTLGAADASLRLAEWQGGALSATDYVDALRRESRGQRPRASLAAEVRRLVGQEVNARLLVAEAERRGLDRDWWVVRSLDRASEERAFQRGVATVLREVVETPEAQPDSVARLLAATWPDLFRARPKVRVLRIDLPSRGAALEELAAIRAAGGPEARLLELVDGEKASAGAYHLLFATAADLPAESVEKILAGAGAVSGPHALGDVWVVLGCLERVEAEQRTPNAVLAELQERQAAGADPRVVAEWVARRERELGVAIDDQVLDALTPGG